MASRRQQKIARVIKESVSTTILTHLSDPRITGLVSITEVDVSPDMKNATVLVSIMAQDDKKRQATFDAICHAIGPIQAQLGRDLPGRVCPHLRFERDDKMKKTIETLRLIEKVHREFTEHPLAGNEPFPEEADDTME
ncbi:MAG: 30S ribosome-binding factor RbfA [Planctomycetaceae bacterium]|nr:30S ribosome-binding factor RbfA [Planctomycetaceae bacterium]